MVITEKLGEIVGALRDYPVLPADDREVMIGLVQEFHGICSDLRFVCSAATLSRLATALKEASSDDLIDLYTELKDRFIDETGGIAFLYLSPQEAGYFESPRAGWTEIIERFPQTVSDIEEARKCFALSRYAASVFHSLHVVETCLIELGTYIGVEDPQSGWTAVSNRLTAIVKAKYGTLTEFERKNRPFLEQVQGTVDSLKNAWRNKISHAQGKLFLLSVDFTPEIAEEILYATRAFARRLVDGLPSLPNPEGGV